MIWIKSWGEAVARSKTQEDKNIEYLETRYMYEKRNKIYLANEETNQTWDETDIPDVIQAWNNNWSIVEIAEYLGSDKWEMLLLFIDLLKVGKIKGNVHVFKPKKRKVDKAVEIDMNGEKIRIVVKEKQMWVCLKDVWRWIRKPEHTYRKVTEAWGPDVRAKFKIDTIGGSQDFIFINIQGLSVLCKHLKIDQIKKIDELKGALKDGMGISSRTKTTT